ncbi:uncharacterized protein BT62DRAFT_195052 [Guyanagaster necrorhizus]|uniref:CAP-Gly domain-containing protein n=1 Tax=Guyanagaster necrorhizus TaxID=856835 RepID=A0A9P7VRE7_9AGAR|nr:uncharacterized protein BT62DRAFT_195052 [Guyanagaster necrorhizus MCA 3950]KAG7445442.1 hypothetical protein BT62DRAFT_195052 [Guyanagaster necrorhizus MCA 3950]
MLKPRQSGIPTPGRARSLSRSQSYSHLPTAHEDEELSRAFEDVMRGRPPSITSYPTTTAPSRAKTPVSKAPGKLTASTSRPPSRTSGRPPSSLHTFEEGDKVRIESLGFEGTLRYVGEIEGKAGLWAGVELAGGFAGKGKNNGSVGGKQYFTCPPQCGVFVTTTKLSTATAGVTKRPPSGLAGRATPSSSGRPPSSLGGRTTPSISNGKITSGANGRVTPSISNGRVTPSMSYTRKPAVPTIAPAPRLPRKSIINTVTPTPGTRASKYAGMTATQLRSSPQKIASPSGIGLGSPSGIGRSLASPNRSISAVGGTPSLPLTTPKPSGKRRIPSGVAMPPPPSPIRSGSPTRSISVGSTASPSLSIDLDARSRDIQARIAEISGGGTGKGLDSPFSGSLKTEMLPPTSSPSTSRTSPVPRRSMGLGLTPSSPSLRRSKDPGPALRPESSISMRSDGRVEALIDDNERLRADVERLKVDLAKLESEKTMKDEERQGLKLEVERAKGLKEEEEKRREELESKREELETRREELEKRVSELEGQIREKDAAGDAHARALADLESKYKEGEAEGGKLKKAILALEEERHDLMSQVDELREAGQETIALYEERLRATDVQKYEMQDRLAELEARVPAAAPPAITLSAGQEIDNETLRDQVLHLQKKIAGLEDMVEDGRVAAEASEDEERGRRGEAEEALRESMVTLEEARAELEGLRSEFNLNGLEGKEELARKNAELQQIAEEQVAQLGKLHQRLDDQAVELEALRKKVNREVVVTSSKSEMKSAQEEIRGLKHIVRELQAEASRLESENKMLIGEMEELRQEVKILEDSMDREEEGALSDDADVEDLRKKLAEAEKKNLRVASDLNKEISELEALVESKIYREDELEQEIERLKAKLAKKSSSSSKHSDTSSIRRVPSTSSLDASVVCEICERPGHDIFSCDLLKGDAPAPINGTGGSMNGGNKSLFCEDCESYGHLPVDCPHSMDVF